MNKGVTFAKLLYVLLPMILAAFAWGKTVETKYAEHHIRITQLERTNGKIEAKLDKMDETLTNILIQMQNKKNRE